MDGTFFIPYISLVAGDLIKKTNNLWISNKGNSVKCIKMYAEQIILAFIVPKTVHLRSLVTSSYINKNICLFRQIAFLDYW